MTTPTTANPDLGEYQYGFHDDIKPVVKFPKGLSEQVVSRISEIKDEPEWMRDFRLKSLRIFEKKAMPRWGGKTWDIDFDDIHYYVKPSDRTAQDWDDVPEDIKRTFERLGIPEAERKFLAGVEAQ